MQNANSYLYFSITEKNKLLKSAFPYLSKLEKQLGAIASNTIVALELDPKNKIWDLIYRGKVYWNSNTTLIKGTPKHCHANCAAFFESKEIDTIITGYALSHDSIWRKHSWGSKNNIIIETTEVRNIYFGITLNPLEIKGFINENSW